MHKYEVPRRFAAQEPEFRSFTVTRQGETTPVVVEAPEGWSHNAVSVFASHYMRVVNGVRESSVRQSVERVSSTIARWAVEDGYFGADAEEARAEGEAFAAELRGLLYSQTLTFNSPVWYNVGITERPQCSACYIQRVDDDMEDIIALQASEMRLFKRGSGTGSNLSTLRPAGWPLSGGGSASGPASFMRGYDAWAGVTKSGGETRRAAKGVWLDCDHPDIEQFVEEKREVEQMARDLVAAGHPADWNGKVSRWLPFQNANHSVRATDAFMRAVANDEDWILSWGGKAVKTVRARDLWGQICRAAAECGDPGIQFHDTINSWHTSPSGGPQRGTNPCCFTGDTLVRTSEGMIRFDELCHRYENEYRRLPKVACFDGEQVVMRSIVRVWSSGLTSKLCTVTTRGGVSVKCTPEHPFMVQDGSYVNAAEIKPSQLGIVEKQTPHTVLRAVDSGGGRGVDEAVSVKRYRPRQEEYVYDMEVDGIHNFAVSSPGANMALIVHNSEFSYIDDSACNLAHLILQRFLPADRGEAFDAAAMRDAVHVSILAQDAIVDRSSYPTPEIAANSLKYRPLGLGYAGLGALLMQLGMAYDSDEGRAVSGVVTSLLAASAWEASAELAAVRGRFDVDERDAAATRAALQRHAGTHAASGILSGRMNGVWHAAKWTWRNAVESYEAHGVRNGQLTLLAPTGTCGLAADCDSTGCEPYFAPVTYKSLAGGGGLKIAVEATDSALRVLGYEGPERHAVLRHVAEHERFDDAPHLKPHHLPVFDCAIPGKGGSRCISPEAHVRMMAAVQPFLSGAISKTVNLPRGSGPDVVGRVYELAWLLGVKTIALYVDGSKFSQPISTGKAAGKAKVAPPSALGSNDGAPPQRRRLPQDRRSATRHFEIGGVDGYITVGFHDDGTVGEVFTRLGKAGDTIGGLLDAWAITFSTALQYGVPLVVLVAKGEGVDFSPHGFTGDDLRAARSVVDYVCRYLRRFLPEHGDASQVADSPTAFSNAGPVRVSGPPCTAGTGCPGAMARRGACMQCDACGHRSGCGA